jgi:hypothetical protein
MPGNILQLIVDKHPDVFDYVTIEFTKRNSNAVKLDHSRLLRMYENPWLDSKQKKFIGVQLTGMFGKFKDTKSGIVVLHDKHEALMLQQIYGGRIIPQVPRPRVLVCNGQQEEEQDRHYLKQGQEVYWLITNDVKLLANGFLTLRLQVLARARWIEHLKYLEIMERGDRPIAIHTDNIFYQSSQEQRLVIPDGDAVENFGKFKVMKLTNAMPSKPIVDRTGLDYNVYDRQQRRKIYPIRELRESIKEPRKLKFISLSNEKDWNHEDEEVRRGYIKEAIDYIQDNSVKRLILSASVPGGGKSYLSMQILLHHHKQGMRSLVVASTNRRVIGLRKELKGMGMEDIPCKTIHSVLKFTFKKGVLAQVKEGINPFKDVDVLIVDEIFAIDISLLDKLWRYIRKNPNLTVIANGDVHQSRVTTNLSCIEDSERDEYYLRCVQSEFSHGINLLVNKRMDPESTKVLKELKAQFRDDDRKRWAMRKAIETAEEAGDEEAVKQAAIVFRAWLDALEYPALREVEVGPELIARHFDENNEFRGVCPCYTHALGNRVGDYFMQHYMKVNSGVRFVCVNGFYFYKGQIVRCLQRVNALKGMTIFPGMEYKVTKIEKSVFMMKCKDKKERPAVKIHLRCIADKTDKYVLNWRLDKPVPFSYNFWATCHSIQGDTFERGTPVTCFGFNHGRCSANDKLVAVSRTRSMEDVAYCRAFAGDIELTDTISTEDMLRRIHGYQVQDEIAERLHWPPAYITEDWIRRQLVKQDHACYACG